MSAPGMAIEFLHPTGWRDFGAAVAGGRGRRSRRDGESEAFARSAAFLVQSCGLRRPATTRGRSKPRSAVSFRGDPLSAGAKVVEHREDAAVRVGIPGDAQLVEDLGDVRLDGPLRDE